MAKDPMTRLSGISIPTKRDAAKAPQAAPASIIDDESFHSKYLIFNPRYPVADVRLNPQNEVFRKYKDPVSLGLLKQDIKEHGVTQAIVVTQSGLLMEGESRCLMSLELVAEGHESAAFIPAMVYSENISDDEATQRLLRSNLTRFQIPNDDKLFLICAAFPDFAANPDALTRGQIAVLAQVSEEMAKKLKQMAKIALDVAQNEGKNKIDQASIEKAKSVIRDKRASASPAGASAGSASGTSSSQGATVVTKQVASVQDHQQTPDVEPAPVASQSEVAVASSDVTHVFEPDANSPLARLHRQLDALSAPEGFSEAEAKAYLLGVKAAQEAVQNLINGGAE